MSLKIQENDWNIQYCGEDVTLKCENNAIKDEIKGEFDKISTTNQILAEEISYDLSLIHI